jgi:hypothetical protein
VLEPRLVSRRTLASAAALVLIGCGDPNQTTGPSAPSSAAVAANSTSGTKYVVPRSTAISVGLSATAWITPDGGTLDLPVAGLRVTFPAGAVAAPVQVTVRTASATRIAYDFAPRGLSLARPATVEQVLPSGQTWTDAANRGELFGTYTVQPFNDSGDGTVRPDATYSAQLEIGTTTVACAAYRLAGYQLASGRKK